MSEKRSGFPNDRVVILLFVRYILVVNFQTSLILRVGCNASPGCVVASCSRCNVILKIPISNLLVTKRKTSKGLGNLPYALKYPHSFASYFHKSRLSIFDIMTKTYSHTQCTTNSSKETSIQHIKIVESQGNTVLNFFFQATATTLLTEGLFFPLLLAPFPTTLSNHLPRGLISYSYKLKMERRTTDDKKA